MKNKKRSFLKNWIKRKFKNQQAIDNLLNNYDKQVKSFMAFPIGYRGISVEYRGYEIRIKPFDTYNLFFVVNEEERSVTILRDKLTVRLYTANKKQRLGYMELEKSGFRTFFRGDFKFIIT